MDSFVHSLRAAESLVAVARTIFSEAVSALGATGATMELYTSSGTPIVCATTAPIGAERTYE